MPYPLDPSRTMIALQPVFLDKEASSLEELLTEPDKLQIAITDIIRTMLQLLSLNVVTIDVQPLISSETGEILFIDFTEAMIILNNNGRVENQEKAIIQNFINEMMVLIPFAQQDTIASKIFLREILNYPIHSCTAYETLLEQNFSLDALNQIRESLCQLRQLQ
jgi:hypothetical protein